MAQLLQLEHTRVGGGHVVTNPHFGERIAIVVVGRPPRQDHIEIFPGAHCFKNCGRTAIVSPPAMKSRRTTLSRFGTRLRKKSVKRVSATLISALHSGHTGSPSAASGVFRDSTGRFKVVILLRPDIFASLGLQNQNAKIQDNSIYLDWLTTYPQYRHSEIFEVADRLLAVQQADLSDSGIAWNHYFPFRNVDDEPSFVSFLRVSFFRPRDIFTR
jgi:hypothetical protein